VGAQPAVLRAALMGIIAIPAYLLGRKVIGIHSLVLTAAILAALNPFILWDVSFQLSFCATFGILMFSDYLSQQGKVLIERSRLPSPEVLHGFLRDYLFTTLAAQLATFPVMITYFQGFSLFSPLVNMLILPLQPIIMVLGGMALLVGMFFFPLGQLLGLLTWFVAAFNDQIVLLFSRFSLSVFIDQTWGFWISIALNVLLFYRVLRNRQKQGPLEEQLSAAV
jgi:competence protein ComEC